MALVENRLLLLGAVAFFGPVNGYQIRRELMSWRVDEWARINPGSIYTGLGTLTRRGHLTRHDLRDGTREVAVYEITPAGRRELDALFRSALEVVDVQSPVAFHVAVSLLPLIGRVQAQHHLEQRLKAIDEVIQRLVDEARHGEDSTEAPPHVVRLVDLWRTLAEGERDWSRDFLARIQAGELYFAGESRTWEPAADDPGWQMARDRARYEGLLGRG